MRIFGISDLHLSFGRSKPMEVFAITTNAMVIDGIGVIGVRGRDQGTA